MKLAFLWKILILVVVIPLSIRLGMLFLFDIRLSAIENGLITVVIGLIYYLFVRYRSSHRVS